MDPEDLLHSLPSSLGRKEADRCCLINARVINVNSTKARVGGDGLHPEKLHVRLDLRHHWSRHAHVATWVHESPSPGRMLWLTGPPPQHPPEFGPSCALLILPTWIWPATLSFPRYYLTIRILGMGPRVKLLGSSCVSRSTNPTRLSVLHDLRLSGLFPQKQVQLRNSSMAKATQGKAWHWGQEGGPSVQLWPCKCGTSKNKRLQNA